MSGILVSGVNAVAACAKMVEGKCMPHGTMHMVRLW